MSNKYLDKKIKKLKKTIDKTNMIWYYITRGRQEHNKKGYAPLAQLVEHLTLNQGVRGSSPRWCTIKLKILVFKGFSAFFVKKLDTLIFMYYNIHQGV